MKITHNKVGQNLNLRDNAGAIKGGDAKKAEATSKSSAAAGLSDVAKGDVGAGKGAVNDAGRVTLSSRAQDMRQAKDIAMATPDVDEAKVARLQKMIDAGEYKIDADKIADKMIDEHANWAD